MLCDICKKNEATIHIKEMHNNKWRSINLCAECAEKNNLGTPDSIPQMDISQMLIGLGKALEEQNKKTKKNAPAQKENIPLSDVPNCPVCNWGIEDIRKNPGKLGCPSCYVTFHDLIDNTCKKIQKGAYHVGKRPLNAPENGKKSYSYALAILQKQLAACVADENYEEAAKKRDQIKVLKLAYEKKGSDKKK